MDLTSINILKKILSDHNVVPREGWGQNFLISKKVLEQIINVADIKKNDVVLEVGGGVGTLTQELAARAKEVTVIEKDPYLMPVLERVLSEYKNVSLIKADALKLEALPYSQNKNKWRIIANIPYWITGRFIRIVLESKHPPTDIILMVQKEIAQRLCARPPHMSLLSVSVQYYGEPEIIINDISPDNFWPASGVNSAVIKIRVLKNKKNLPGDKAFFNLTRSGFAHPRKQLKSNLKRAFNLTDEQINTTFAVCGLKETARAQELSIQDWKCLLQEIDV